MLSIQNIKPSNKHKMIFVQTLCDFRLTSSYSLLFSITLLLPLTTPHYPTPILTTQHYITPIPFHYACDRHARRSSLHMQVAQRLSCASCLEANAFCSDVLFCLIIAFCHFCFPEFKYLFSYLDERKSERMPWYLSFQCHEHTRKTERFQSFFHQQRL